MAFSHIRDDVSSKQARRQISLLTSYGGVHSNYDYAESLFMPLPYDFITINGTII